MAAVSTSSLHADIQPLTPLQAVEEASITAEVTCGGGAVPAMTFDVGVSRIGRRSMDLVALPEATLDVLKRVRFAWLSVDIEGLSIKPLVEVVNVTAKGASVRYRHLFPKQQAQLDAFNQQ